MSYRKGARAERELINLLRENGFAVIRAAGSKPIDFLAAKSGKIIAFEVKYWQKNSPLNGVFEKLQKTAEAFGALPVLAVKRRYQGWKFYILAGNSKVEVKIEDIIDNYLNC